MKRIETRDNEFIEQFRKSLQSSFPPVLNFAGDYYLGEEKGVKGLYFTLTSRFGVLYSNIANLERGQVIADIEDDFINEIIDNLIMNGVTFFNLLAFDSVDPKRVMREINAKNFRHSTPRKLLYQN
jgi:hypothetical protein